MPPSEHCTLTAVLVSRFPKVSETFVAREAIALQSQGCKVRVYALTRENSAVVQPEAAVLLPDAVFGRVDVGLLGAQLRWLRKDPARYLRTWTGALRGNLRSRRFLLRAFVVVPVAARWALEMPEQGVSRVHAHFATHAALAGWVINRLTDLPFSFTVHAHDLYVDREMLVEKVAAADLVVTISDFNQRLLEDVCGKAMTDHRVRVVRCGVDRTIFRRRPVAPANPVTKIVCVGTLEQKKGQRHLIEAVARLRDRGRTVEAVFVGEGDDRASLESDVARLAVADSVRLPGAGDRAAVLAALESADVVVLPSVIDDRGRMEGIPVSLMEAMAVGVPVIASDLSGISELVVDGVTGLLVVPGDAAALADAIERLIGDPDLARRVTVAATRVVAEKYDLTSNVAELAELFGPPTIPVGAPRKTIPQ